MNLFNIERAFTAKKERGWNTLYVVVDAHGTLIKPYHDCIEFYDGAVEVIKWFNSRMDFCVILWTSSHSNEITAIDEASEKEGIRFDFVNENPMENSSDMANFNEKFYFNILLDDKAGFDPMTDWKLIKEELIRLGEWDRFDKVEKSVYNNSMNTHAIYIGEPIELKDPSDYVGYGQTGAVKEIEKVTDKDHRIFIPDGINIQVLVPLTDLYFSKS